MVATSTELVGSGHELSRGRGVPAMRYLAALLEARLQDADAIVRQEVVHGLDHVYSAVLQPALYEIGRLWETSQLNVAQEHFCTAATQQIMASLRAQLRQEPKASRRLLATSIGGNFHAVGIRVLSNIFELAGWEIRSLGVDSSAELVREALAATRCDVLALSAARKEHIPVVGSLIATLRQSPSGAMPWILVVGRAFNAEPARWREVGADGHAATPADAVVMADRLLETGVPTVPTPLLVLAPSPDAPSAARPS